MTEEDEVRSVAWDPVARSYSAAALRALHRRLRLFSSVVPRPKEAEGDSLRVAFRLEDPDRGRDLLAALGLEASSDLQRPSTAPFAGTTVQASVDRHPADEHGEPRYAETVAVVRLWNEAAVHDVTPSLVDRAALVEERLTAAGTAALPRETRLHGWITPERDPECFDR